MPARPLNQSVIAQVLHDLSSGQTRRCKAMGFGDEELEAIWTHPEIASLLANTQVVWCTATVNRDVLHHLLLQLEDSKPDGNASMSRMLRLGASTGMPANPLNQNVIAWVLHDLSNGQTRRCKAMGFWDKELAAIRMHPEAASLLANTQVVWCAVTASRDVLRRLLKLEESKADENSAIDRMLRLGASTEMMSRLCGMTHKDVAERRRWLALSTRKGRYPALGEDESKLLWHRWKKEVSEKELSVENEKVMLSTAMSLSEATRIPLVVVWTAVEDWIKQEQQR